MYHVFSSSKCWCRLRGVVHRTKGRPSGPVCLFLCRLRVDTLCSAVVLRSSQIRCKCVHSTTYFRLLSRKAAARRPGGRRSRLWPAGDGTRRSWARKGGCGRAGGGSTAAWASETRKVRYRYKIGDDASSTVTAGTRRAATTGATQESETALGVVPFVARHGKTEGGFSAFRLRLTLSFVLFRIVFSWRIHPKPVNPSCFPSQIRM